MITKEQIQRMREMGEAMEKAKWLIPFPSVQESLREYEALYYEFLPRLKETESVFLPEKEQSLIQFQEQFEKFAQWEFRKNAQ